MAKLWDVCDALVLELGNASSDADWPGLPLIVERKYLHTFDEQDTTFRASISPATLDSERASRDRDKEETEIVIVLSKRVTDTTNATIDPLINTAQAVMELWADPGDQMDDEDGEIDDTFVMDASCDPLYDRELLDEKSLFVAVITVKVWSFVAANGVPQGAEEPVEYLFY